MAFRFLLLNFGFALLLALLGVNLYRLQVVKGSEYLARAETRAAAREEFSLRRGSIFVTNRSGADIPVALPRDRPIVYADPARIEDVKETAALLAPLLGTSPASLEETLASPGKRFRLLSRDPSDELVAAVREMEGGVYLDTEQYRAYPFDHFASHLLGFVGMNAEAAKPRGLYGVEKYLNDALAAERDVRLSIDRDVQVEAEGILARLMSGYGATGGTVIVMDPATGKLLALASVPDFDPNEYRASPLARFVNPAFAHQYEPGSVMKAITMAAALDGGAVTPATTYTDKGSLTRDRRTIHNFDNKVYGTVTMTNVIERSINTGSVYAAEALGREKFLPYLERFGFGAPTGVGASEEVPGSLKNLTKSDTKAIDLATASFGQGTAVTPLQMAVAYGALANKGVRVTPSFLADEAPREAGRAVSEKAAGEVLAMMESAVRVNKVAVIPGYRVAGKTGTALIPDFEKGGYSDALIHTFIGIAPVSSPRFVVLAKLDRPQVGELAGITVVPAVRDLLEFLLGHYRVPPDNVPLP